MNKTNLYKILKLILSYIIFYIAETFLFSFVFCVFSGNRGDYLSCWLTVLRGEQITFQSNYLALLAVFKELVEVVALAILTSYMFTYILNKEPKLIFPDKLVIRHRSNGELTLGVLIGNKNQFNIYNAVCTITCAYVKEVNPLIINSETTLKDERVLLENYYRFSFQISEIPHQLLKDFVDKNEYFSRDTLLLCFSGSCNQLGNHFSIIRNYSLSDIVIDEHEPEVTTFYKNIFTGHDLVNPFTKQKIKKISWKEITKIVEVSEKNRYKTISEIRNLIK